MTSLGGSGQDEHPDESHAHAKAAHLVGRVADSMKLEAQGVAEGARWSMRARSPALLETTLRELHRRMFNETWAWAGRYRRSDKNVGVHWPTGASGAT